MVFKVHFSLFKRYILPRDKSGSKNCISSFLYFCNSLNLCQASFIMLTFYQGNFKTFFFLNGPIKVHRVCALSKSRTWPTFCVFMLLFIFSCLWPLTLINFQSALPEIAYLLYHLLTTIQMLEADSLAGPTQSAKG